MTSVRIGVLFPSTFNLNADAANATVLAKRLQLSGWDAEIEAIDIEAIESGISVDALIVGSPSSSIVTAPETTSKLVRDFFGSAMESATPILAVSNGMHLFGTMTSKTGEAIAGWGIVPMHTTFGSSQHVTIGMRLDTAWGPIVGVENHNAQVELSSEVESFGSVLHGVGNGVGSADGVIFGSLWGTHVHGPLFALNPIVADEFARRVVTRVGGEYVPGPGLAAIDELAANTAAHLVRKQSS